MMETAASLLTAVHELRQQKARQDIVEFGRLRADWAKWREKRIISESTTTPRHNLIRLVGLECSEVGLHSPFLRDLLDPSGTHGQGALFLRAFLKLIDQKLNHNSNPLAGTKFHSNIPDVPESGDWNVLCEREKIDIRIYSPKAGLLVFIENKIDAGEQERQITRYKELLDRQKNFYPHRLLIGLSRRGYIFRTGDPDIQLTYEDDIYSWLTEAEQQITDSAVKLRGNICQYREIVQSFCGVEDMQNQELIDLIIKPENIHCAWDIADAISSAENQLRCRFWCAIAESIKNELANAVHATGWVVAGLEETCRNTTKSDAGVYLTAGTAPNSAALRIGVWQEGKHVFHGVGFTRASANPNPLGEKLEALRAELPEEWRRNEMNSHWMGWCWTPYYTDSREFLFSVLTDAETTAQAVTETVIGVLRNQSLWRQVVETNNALSAYITP